jgi:hypothetical protein
MTGVTASFTHPTLIALSMNVGTANAASASGPEFPQPVIADGVATSGGAAGAGGGAGPVGLISRCARPSNVVDICSSSDGLALLTPTCAPAYTAVLGTKAFHGRSEVLTY